jgi:transposase
MVREEMYNKIQALRRSGYSIRRCAREVDIDRKTVRKYWNMSPDEYVAYLAKCMSRTKILDPYRDEIVLKMETYPNITAAIVYDQLREKHSGFSPSYRSVSLYVTMLREKLGIPTQAVVRQYTEVAEQAPGRQLQVDMGQKVMRNTYGRSVRIYIFAAVLSHSRKKFVYFQDHPFNTNDFIYAHSLTFLYYGGRTEEIVYDQDRIMTVSENAGDIILTEAFESYRRYVGFGIHLCRGNDPESKGKIENVVKYVKHNYLACREYHGIQELNSGGLLWLDRTANAKIHETTKLIPDRVFDAERKLLLAAPTISESPKHRSAIIRKTNVVHFGQNRYEVPKGTYRPGRVADIDVDNAYRTVEFKDPDTGELLAKHMLCMEKGKLVKLPRNQNRYQGNNYDELRDKTISDVIEIPGASVYIDKLIEAYPRYAKDQLSIMSKCIASHSREELLNAFEYCTRRDLISANDFRDTLVYFRSEQPATTKRSVSIPAKYLAVQANVRDIDVYKSKTTAGGAK